MMTNMTVDVFEHISGSSSDPWYIAERYGISKRAVDMIQMGRLDVSDAAGCNAQQIDDLALRAMEKLNIERMRQRSRARQALTAPAPRKSLLSRLLGR